MRFETPEELRIHLKAWICLGLGLFLCILSGCTPEPVETELLLPVDFSNIPEDMLLTAYHTDKIKIRVKGKPRVIDRLLKEPLTYPADLYTDLAFDPGGESDNIDTGTYVLPVEKSRFPLDPSVTILSISPAFLSVRLEKEITRSYKISVPYTGTPAKGYLALAPAINPPTVELTGAQSLLDSLSGLKTKPVDLTRAGETFKKEMPLALDPSLPLKASKTIFIVTVPIQAEMEQRTIENLPIHLLHKKGRVSLTPDTISIKIKGPADVLDSRTVMDEIYAFMDLRGLAPGVHARHVFIDVPVDIVMTSAFPQVFTVKID